MPRTYNRARRLPQGLRSGFDAATLAEFFNDNFELLAFAVLYVAFSDLRKPETRADAERFMQSVWFENLALALELTPEHWRRLATRITAHAGLSIDNRAQGDAGRQASEDK